MVLLLIAVFGAIASFFTWRAAVHSKAMVVNIQTNHGKRPGEYLEMIADVMADLKEHTRQDDRNFAAVKALFATAESTAKRNADG